MWLRQKSIWNILLLSWVPVFMLNDSPVFLFTGTRLASSLLAVRTQTLIIFWAKGISFIHSWWQHQTNIHIETTFPTTSHCKKATFSSANPTYCIRFYRSTINWIMVGLPKDLADTSVSLELSKVQVRQSVVHIFPVMKFDWPHQRLQLWCKLRWWLAWKQAAAKNLLNLSAMHFRSSMTILHGAGSVQYCLWGLGVSPCCHNGFH